jgi:hypothetical protein
MTSTKNRPRTAKSFANIELTSRGFSVNITDRSTGLESSRRTPTSKSKTKEEKEKEEERKQKVELRLNEKDASLEGVNLSDAFRTWFGNDKSTRVDKHYTDYLSEFLYELNQALRNDDIALSSTQSTIKDKQHFKYKEEGKFSYDQIGNYCVCTDIRLGKDGNGVFANIDIKQFSIICLVGLCEKISPEDSTHTETDINLQSVQNVSCIGFRNISSRAGPIAFMKHANVDTLLGNADNEIEGLNAMLIPIGKCLIEDLNVMKLIKTYKEKNQIEDNETFWQFQDDVYAIVATRDIKPKEEIKFDHTGGENKFIQEFNLNEKDKKIQLESLWELTEYRGDCCVAYELEIDSSKDPMQVNTLDFINNGDYICLLDQDRITEAEYKAAVEQDKYNFRGFKYRPSGILAFDNDQLRIRSAYYQLCHYEKKPLLTAGDIINITTIITFIHQICGVGVHIHCDFFVSVLRKCIATIIIQIEKGTPKQIKSSYLQLFELIILVSNIHPPLGTEEIIIKDERMTEDQAVDKTMKNVKVKLEERKGVSAKEQRYIEDLTSERGSQLNVAQYMKTVCYLCNAKLKTNSHGIDISIMNDFSKTLGWANWNQGYPSRTNPPVSLFEDPSDQGELLYYDYTTTNVITYGHGCLIQWTDDAMKINCQVKRTLRHETNTHHYYVEATRDITPGTPLYIKFDQSLMDTGRLVRKINNNSLRLRRIDDKWCLYSDTSIFKGATLNTQANEVFHKCSDEDVDLIEDNTTKDSYSARAPTKPLSFLSYLAHSTNPNTEYDFKTKTLKATKDINKGTPWTIKYSNRTNEDDFKDGITANRTRDSDRFARAVIFNKPASTEQEGMIKQEVKHNTTKVIKREVDVLIYEDDDNDNDNDEGEEEEVHEIIQIKSNEDEHLDKVNSSFITLLNSQRNDPENQGYLLKGFDKKHIDRLKTKGWGSLSKMLTGGDNEDFELPMDQELESDDDDETIIIEEQLEILEKEYKATNDVKKKTQIIAKLKALRDVAIKYKEAVDAYDKSTKKRRVAIEGDDASKKRRISTTTKTPKVDTEEEKTMGQLREEAINRKKAERGSKVIKKQKPSSSSSVPMKED